MITIRVRHPMNDERAKCDQRRAYEKIFHALIIPFLALAVGGCQTISAAVGSVPKSWWTSLSSTVISWVTPEAEEGSAEK